MAIHLPRAVRGKATAWRDKVGDKHICLAVCIRRNEIRRVARECDMTPISRDTRRSTVSVWFGASRVKVVYPAGDPSLIVVQEYITQSVAIIGN